MLEISSDEPKQLRKNGGMISITSAVRVGRPAATDIVPGTVIRHFLYKSRANVQFAMPSFTPDFDSPLDRRGLFTLYHGLHADAHAKNAHLKVHHVVAESSVALAWLTPSFELYAVAGPNATRAALAHGANLVTQWYRREEERVFIVGGAVRSAYSSSNELLTFCWARSFEDDIKAVSSHTYQPIHFRLRRNLKYRRQARRGFLAFTYPHVWHRAWRGCGTRTSAFAIPRDDSAACSGN